jgi:hypothetical protein
MRPIFILFLGMFFSQVAFAESGTVESISGGPYQVTTNDFGDSKHTVFTIKLVGTTLKSDVSFIKVGSTFIAECAGSSTADGRGSKVEGTCLVTDGEGDKYKLKFSRAKSGTGGVQTWEGMTGKYVGAKGDCTYEHRPQAHNGTVYGINPAKCMVTK